MALWYDLIGLFKHHLLQFLLDPARPTCDTISDMNWGVEGHATGNNLCMDRGSVANPFPHNPRTEFYWYQGF